MKLHYTKTSIHAESRWPKLVLIATAIVAVSIITFLFLQKMNTPDSTALINGEEQENVSDADDSTPSESGASETPFIFSIDDQPTGSRVILSGLSFAERAWVAVYEDREGEPGNILGAARFHPESQPPYRVPLLRATEAGGTYYAIVHIDDGDLQFDMDTDIPYTDADGAMIIYPFTALR